MRTRTDLLRQITVTVSVVVCIVGSMIGVGVFGGTPIAEAAGGALSASATRLAPAGAAFSIWTVVYAGLVAFTIWQWRPSQRTSPRQRALGWLVAASMLLNAAWILSIQAGLLNLSVGIIVLLLVVLAVAFRRYTRDTASTWPEAVAVDGTLGLYLGWVCVAVCANITAALTAAGFDGFGINPDAWATAVLFIVAAVGVRLAKVGRGRLAFAAAVAWGLAWIAVGRFAGPLESTTTAAAALTAAAVVVIAAVVIRVRTLSRPAHP
ncbi:tryptophan-rich sensory protein [Arthrobacter sp. H5]|uniref:tryptophan-rich sensory protein n=1 Tax=Arthrobacter sp. H5 TaxID=1267973 RepID=UPI0004B4569E|nr:tryptophan-rich sensory protein [Arthrobacter sp. H5]